MATPIASAHSTFHHGIVASLEGARSFSRKPLQAIRRLLRTSIRLRLAEHGPQALSDVELLSILLRTDGDASTHDLALKLLTHFGSLRGLFRADLQAARSHGLSVGNFTTLQAALEIARRHYHELMVAGPVLPDLRAMHDFLRARMRDLPHEVFAVLHLDRRHRVIHFQEMFRGTIDGATVHPREVVGAALTRNATAVVVAHNHPSGVAEPSRADEQITRVLKQALALVEVRLIDHLIIGDGVVTSLAERGLL